MQQRVGVDLKDRGLRRLEKRCRAKSAKDVPVNLAERRGGLHVANPMIWYKVFVFAIAVISEIAFMNPLQLARLQ